MDIKSICPHIDHTLLAPTSTWPEVRRICEEALAYGAASVCIPPCYVKDAAVFLAGRIPVCTVIVFPNGYSTPSAKVQETRQALEDGAEEIDMVINVAFLKDGRFDAVREEIGALRKETDGKILKVIVETCYLTEEEKIRMCKIVRDAGADYIKTSTGFGTGNATPEDVTLFARCLEGSNVKIKASGGIRTWEDAEMYLSLSADRLGSSALIKSLAD